MTFSIVAYDPKNGDFGVAVQSKFLCVGQIVPWAKANVGAVATQANVNTSFGPRGLELLEKGYTSEEVVAELLKDDELKEQRQLAVIDKSGIATPFTGSDAFYWAGHKAGKYYSCQGNILVDEKTVADMSNAFESTEGDLADKLLAVMRAADQPGRGDVRGKQSAAILIVRNKAKERAMDAGDRSKINEGDATLIIDKQRENGWEGTIQLQFNRNCDLFYDANKGPINYLEDTF